MPDENEMPEREMDDFDQELTRAMRRVDAPRGFADRVVARAGLEGAVGPAATRDAKVLGWPRRRAWLSGAVAAGLGLAAVAGGALHEREATRQVAQQRAAETQFETAMRVTDRALETTRRQVSRAGVRLDLQ